MNDASTALEAPRSQVARSRPDRPKALLVGLLAWTALDIGVHVAVDIVEPLRIAGNVALALPAVAALTGRLGRGGRPVVRIAAAVCVGLNLGQGIAAGVEVPMAVFVGVGVVLALLAARDLDGPAFPRAAQVVASLLVLGLALGGGALVGPITSVGVGLADGRLEASDLWGDEPAILSAGLGFVGILGLEDTAEATVLAAGGGFASSLVCADGAEPDEAHRSTVATSDGIERFGVGGRPVGEDGLPIVFSWPIATETAHPEDFRFTTNTGRVVVPTAMLMLPNWELGERNTIVAVGQFGNREGADSPDAEYPVRLDIVDDGTPLQLVGPAGTVSAVGLSWQTTTTPYEVGPLLVGAKLNRVDPMGRGEGGIVGLESAVYMPNDEGALYDEGDFRLRMLTSGGFSPDGVTGLTPDAYGDFFRIHATGADGATVLLEQVGVDYSVAGGTLRVVGLSDLGRAEDPQAGVRYDGCYAEDGDNYIDVILVGDDEAARSITHLEIPAREGGYASLFNPGGPGPDPVDGVRYTAPGPPDLEPVVDALDDPLRVTRDPG